MKNLLVCIFCKDNGIKNILGEVDDSKIVAQDTRFHILKKIGIG